MTTAMVTIYRVFMPKVIKKILSLILFVESWQLKQISNNFTLEDRNLVLSKAVVWNALYEGCAVILEFQRRNF
jgi:hypothetical protein